MSSRRTRIGIIGGGIRGTAIAALFAQSEHFEVILFERNLIGSGTTSTNHGRIHCGAGLWRKNLPAMANRHRIGGERIRQLLGDEQIQLPALYLIESPEEASAFESACTNYAIPYKQAGMESPLINKHQFVAAFEVPEYSFNPAQLAGRLAACAEEIGAKICTRSKVQSIEPRPGRAFGVTLASGTTVEVDILINSLGKWVNTLDSVLPLPQPEVIWHKWRILGLSLPPSSNDHLFNRVITVVEPDDVVPSCIPHSGWMLFGCRLTPEILMSPDEEPAGDWRPFHAENTMDRRLLDVHARYFVPLQTGDYEGMMKNLYTFAGTYPTVAGMYPFYQKDAESVFQLIQSEIVPNYYVVCGENATTSISDAVDTVQSVAEQAGADSSDFAISLFSRISSSFTKVVHKDCSPMVWERANGFSTKAA